MSGIGLCVELALPGQRVVRVGWGSSGGRGRGVVVDHRLFGGRAAQRGDSGAGGNCSALSGRYDGAPAGDRYEGCGRTVRDNVFPGALRPAALSWAVREP